MAKERIKKEYYCLLMQSNPYPDPNLIACINKYTPVRQLFLKSNVNKSEPEC